MENLPGDVLGDILARVAKFSRTSIRNAMVVSKKLKTATNDSRIYKNINLKPLAMKPLVAVNRYQDLMERCLENGNVEAHYIKGILEYFHRDNTDTGLRHLEIAAQGSYENAIYLYGVTLLCRGEIEEGKSYLEKLDWKTNKEKAEQCWRNNKRGLHGIRVMRKNLYITTLRANRPVECGCNINRVNRQCNNCYYYKMMAKFVYII